MQNEANFSLDAWDRETVSSHCVWQRSAEGRYGASYITRVRLTVRAGDHRISREGLGSGKRIRSVDHLRFVAQQPCLVCGRQPCQAHHLRFAQPRALSRKVSDEFTVPLCNFHHDEVHRTGNEFQWWRARGLDPLQAARVYWAETRDFPGASAPVVEEANDREPGPREETADQDRPVAAPP